MVGFRESIKMFFTRAFDFEGRSTRAEYWWAYLFYLLVVITLSIALFIFDDMSGDLESSKTAVGIFAGLFGLILFLFVIVCIIPSIALVVRRFHDLNQTGWLYLVLLIVSLLVPAWIGRLIWFMFPGTQGPNNYGEDPYDDFFEIFE